MISLAGKLLRQYCKPVNHLELIKALADERNISWVSVQAFIDSGEYGIGCCGGVWAIRKSMLFTPTIALGKRGISKQDLFNAVSPIEVFSNEINRPLKDIKWQMVPCPFHDDSNPSMGVLLPDGGYNCMGCGARGGNVIDFVMRLHNMSFPAAIKFIAHRYTSLEID